MQKHYDIYGMGNALVDIEFKIDDQELEKLGIEKGVMTLVEQAEMQRLLSQLSHIKHNTTSGGSAANTVITAQVLGNKNFYSCKVAKDAYGDLFVKQFKEFNLDSNIHNGERENGTTGQCLVKITPDAERTMATFLGITAHYSEREMDYEALEKANYLYIEGYLSAQEQATAAALKAKQVAAQNGVKTALTLSDPNMVKFCKNNLLAIIDNGVDLIFCNEHEAMMFCETDDLAQAKEKLKQYCKTYAITLGSKGVCVFDGSRTQTIAGQKVNVINTVGAGDIFAGSFLYGLSQGYNYAEAARLANIAAGKVVAKLGPRLNQAEADAVLAEFSSTDTTA